MLLLLRNVLLKIEVEALKKKEAEDTQALEDMVQKVESNLVATTVSSATREVEVFKCWGGGGGGGVVVLADMIQKVVINFSSSPKIQRSVSD